MRITAADAQSKKMQFGMWLGLPKSTRQDDEVTLEQLSKKIGTSRECLSRWRDDPYVKQCAENAVKIFGGNDKLAIIQSLVSDAKAKGNVQAKRLYLEWQNEIGTRQNSSKTPSQFNVTFEVEEKK